MPVKEPDKPALGWAYDHTNSFTVFCFIVCRWPVEIRRRNCSPMGFSRKLTGTVWRYNGTIDSWHLPREAVWGGGCVRHCRTRSGEKGVKRYRIVLALHQTFTAAIAGVRRDARQAVSANRTGLCRAGVHALFTGAHRVHAGGTERGA